MWTDDDQQPTRTREELLGRVARRGEELRRRRRAGRGLAAVVAVLAVTAVGGLMTVDGGDRPVQVATGESSATGLLTEPDPVPSIPVEETPITSTTLAGPEPTSTSVPTLIPPPPPTVPPVPASPPPTSTPTTRGAASAGTTSTSPPREQPLCSQAFLEVSAIPVKPEFRPGEPVRVSSTVRNRTTQACYHSSSNFMFRFAGPAGEPLVGGVNHGDGFDQAMALGPGETMTNTADWDQKVCPDGLASCAQAAPGTYTVETSWSFSDAGVATTTSFRLVP